MEKWFVTAYHCARLVQVLCLSFLAMIFRWGVPSCVGLVNWFLPSRPEPRNRIELNDKIEPRTSVDWANDPYLEEKKELMRDFAVDAVNKVAKVLGIRWVELKEDDLHPILPDIDAADLVLRRVGPRIWAHEQGSISMANRKMEGDVVNEHLL